MLATSIAQLRTSSLAGLSLLALCATDVAAQSDQVLVLRSDGRTRTWTGIVESNTLDEVVLTESDGDTRRLEGADVLAVNFGAVPPSYRDGGMLAARGDHDRAAAQFRLAAGDASASEPVRASARLHAARSLIAAGSADPELFAQAQEELARFLQDHASNRELPAARFLRARSTHLAGDPLSAGEQYLSLFAEENNGTPAMGYDLVRCYVAGLRGAEAFLDAGEIDRAQAAYTRLVDGTSNALAALTSDDARKPDVAELQSRGRLGAGHCDRARGSASIAVGFFRRQADDEGMPNSVRLGARLGLAEALLDDGKHRLAQIEFAKVSGLHRSSIDSTDRDRAARALLGLARCVIALQDQNSDAYARTWLSSLIEAYGDTPSAAAARELLRTL